jgi:hypothetical protein
MKLFYPHYDYYWDMNGYEIVISANGDIKYPYPSYPNDSAVYMGLRITILGWLNRHWDMTIRPLMN